MIAELAITEKDFIRDLKITYETFNLHNPAHLEARGIDAVLLFGNILDVFICLSIANFVTYIIYIR